MPGDLSVVSHADTPLAEYSVSPLTAVHMPLAELGAAGVDALVDRIGSGPGSDLEIDAEPRLVVRASTGPPRGHRPKNRLKGQGAT